MDILIVRIVTISYERQAYDPALGHAVLFSLLFLRTLPLSLSASRSFLPDDLHVHALSACSFHDFFTVIAKFFRLFLILTFQHGDWASPTVAFD